MRVLIKAGRSLARRVLARMGFVAPRRTPIAKFLGSEIKSEVTKPQYDNDSRVKRARKTLSIWILCSICAANTFSKSARTLGI